MLARFLRISHCFTLRLGPNCKAFSPKLFNTPLALFSNNKRNDPFKNKNEEEEEEETLSIKDIIIPRDLVEQNFSRSSGAGGQNVNKVNTKAEIRFNVSTCTWLTDEVKQRLRELHGNHINNRDELIVTSQVGRTQSGNLEDAFSKLRTMVYQASLKQKERKNEIPPETQNEERRRLQSKRHRGDVKKQRSKRDDW